jgi:hypothetical protein
LSEDVRYIDEDPDIDEDDDHDDGWSVRISSEREIAGAADELAALAIDQGLPFAERHASLDALLDAYGYGDPEQTSLPVAALLAAANRFDDAEAALAAYRCELSRADERFVRQLRRWIESGGDPSLIPHDPPRRPPALPEMRSVGEVWQQVMSRRAAVEAVKSAGAGRDRDEPRPMLDAELSSRGLTESPLWKERTLDHLYDEPSAGATLDSLRALGRLGLGLVRAIRGELPDPSPPEWLRPPARAGSGIGGWAAERTWVAAVVDPGARAWLDRADAAVPRLGPADPATVGAWLDWDDAAGSRLGVHIGSRRVAGVAPDDVGRCATAATHDERRCLTARLRRDRCRPAICSNWSCPRSIPRRTDDARARPVVAILGA